MVFREFGTVAEVNCVGVGCQDSGIFRLDIVEIFGAKSGFRKTIIIVGGNLVGGNLKRENLRRLRGVLKSFWKPLNYHNYSFWFFYNLFKNLLYI